MLRAALGEHIGAAVKDAFPFDKPRCDRLVKKCWSNLAGQLPTRNHRMRLSAKWSGAALMDDHYGRHVPGVAPSAR
jgi:hypothetical protein